MSNPTSNEESLPDRMKRLWKRIEPGTDDVVLMTQISATLAEAAHELWKLQNEHASLLSGRFPTHRCKVCGALWIEWPPDPANPVPALRAGSWSLFTPVCGKCCDNVAMGDQIERLPDLSKRSAVETEVSQLPVGMEHCTIRLVECPQGHGRLTATNWIDTGCPWCQREAAFEGGWRAAAQWAGRDDLNADIGSLPYIEDRRKALQALPLYPRPSSEETSAPRTPVYPDDWKKPIKVGCSNFQLRGGEFCGNCGYHASEHNL